MDTAGSSGSDDFSFVGTQPRPGRTSAGLFLRVSWAVGGAYWRASLCFWSCDNRYAILVLPHVAAYLTGRVYRAVPSDKTDKLPSGGQWLHEIKHDGFRIIARKSDGRIRLYSRPMNQRAELASATWTADLGYEMLCHLLVTEIRLPRRSPAVAGLIF
jgi:hypothetical protein